MGISSQDFFSRCDLDLAIAQIDPDELVVVLAAGIQPPIIVSTTFQAFRSADQLARTPWRAQLYDYGSTNAAGCHHG